MDLKQKLKNDPMFNPLVALSLMLFILLYATCISADIVFLKESMSFKWTIFMILYTVAVAYIISFLVYQIGSRI